MQLEEGVEVLDLPGVALEVGVFLVAPEVFLEGLDL
jgi:hypothetical protein